MSVDVHHLAAAYVLDALDDHERYVFETHYPSCAVCRDDVSAFRATVDVMNALTSRQPPARLRSEVLGAIASTRQRRTWTPGCSRDVRSP